ncbi:MAG: serine/threonine protein kinase [Deltaproteobacteria bacterium]|jgi:serine/threonine protein kinase|nr:serine/threonine protein kinase [Deltaproteobacteria bacterium]MBW2535937.1 serine/threonine protein kinase [Deltaproteobacteria bacterium]
MQGPARREAPPAVPERIGRYDVLVPIAHGGMATVYLARRAALGGFERDVALKLPHAHLLKSEKFRNELVEEAKLAALIQHPNVVDTLDVGEGPQGVYLVMDYVEGDSLRGLRRIARSERGRLPLRIGMAILLDALAGLHAAHELRGRKGELLNVVHRDFSPHNILVGMDGIGRLTDFGIAKAASRLGTTETGLVKGKLLYMAPEQARGAELDRRADVWAAGVIAWEIATGKPLHPAADMLEYLSVLVNEPPSRARSVAPEVSVALDGAIAGALTLERDERFATAAEFATALREAFPSGADLASVEERAAFVQDAVGVQIEARRIKADRIWKERQRGPKQSAARSGAAKKASALPAEATDDDDTDRMSGGPSRAVGGGSLKPVRAMAASPEPVASAVQDEDDTERTTRRPEGVEDDDATERMTSGTEGVEDDDVTTRMHGGPSWSTESDPAPTTTVDGTAGGNSSTVPTLAPDVEEFLETLPMAEQPEEALLSVPPVLDGSATLLARTKLSVPHVAPTSEDADASGGMPRSAMRETQRRKPAGRPKLPWGTWLVVASIASAALGAALVIALSSC